MENPPAMTIQMFPVSPHLQTAIRWLKVVPSMKLCIWALVLQPEAVADLQHVGRVWVFMGPALWGWCPSAARSRGKTEPSAEMGLCRMCCSAGRQGEPRWKQNGRMQICSLPTPAESLIFPSCWTPGVWC